MGITDEESWFRTRYLPTGRATGWRRTGCLVMLVVALVFVVVAIVLALVVGGEP